MIRDLIQSVSGYPGLFLLCATSGLLVPLPEDFALLYAGMRIANGDMAWSSVLPLAVVGVLLRDVGSFMIGRTVGDWLLARTWTRRIFGGDKKLERAKGLVDDHGDQAVFIGRFLVGFRSPVFVVGGAMGLSLRRFLFWDTMGLLIAVPLTVWLGYAVGQPIVDGMFWGLQRARVVVGILLALALGLLSLRMWREPSDG